MLTAATLVVLNVNSFNICKFQVWVLRTVTVYNSMHAGKYYIRTFKIMFNTTLNFSMASNSLYTYNNGPEFVSYDDIVILHYISAILLKPLRCLTVNYIMKSPNNMYIHTYVDICMCVASSIDTTKLHIHCTYVHTYV